MKRRNLTTVGFAGVGLMTLSWSVFTAEPSALEEEKALPARVGQFTKLETIQVGEFSIDVCRREDGAFGLGEISKGKLLIRRADFLVTWQVNGQFPRLDRRSGLKLLLREPKVTVGFTPEQRDCAGARFFGFWIDFEAERGPIVETASWELNGSATGLAYF